MIYLHVKWSVSKARESYGYNVVTLTDYRDIKIKTCGGGYDMIGTVIGKYLTQYHADRLAILLKMAKENENNPNIKQIPELYGLSFYKNKPSCDGACGLACMLKIAEYIGLKIVRDVSGRGNIIGFFVE